MFLSSYYHCCDQQGSLYMCILQHLFYWDMWVHNLLAILIFLDEKNIIYSLLAVIATHTKFTSYGNAIGFKNITYI